MRKAQTAMGSVVGGIDHLSNAISHATAPAFMLGAVAGFLSILISRLERIVDRNRALRAADDVDPKVREAVAASFARRMQLLTRSIYFAVLSALMTAALLIAAFFAALVGVSHGGIVAQGVALDASLISLNRLPFVFTPPSG